MITQKRFWPFFGVFSGFLGLFRVPQNYIIWLFKSVFWQFLFEKNGRKLRDPARRLVKHFFRQKFLFFFYLFIFLWKKNYFGRKNDPKTQLCVKNFFPLFFPKKTYFHYSRSILTNFRKKFCPKTSKIGLLCQECLKMEVFRIFHNPFIRVF